MKSYKRIEITTDPQPKDGRRRPRSAAVKVKLSSALKGRKLTPEWIANRSASRVKNAKGHSLQARENMSLAQKGHPRCLTAIAASVAARKGKKLSDAHRAKLRRVWAKRKARKAALIRPLTRSTLSVSILGRVVRGKAISGSRYHDPR